MNNLINKKWKIVTPVKTPFSIIQLESWKCRCDKKGDSYALSGCLCYNYNEVLSITKISMMPVYEHIVALHNASLEVK